MEKRKVIIHYHIFKNAGTSIDRMLKESFDERWVNFDRPEASAKISPSELETFILDQPDLVAVSSHHAVPPLPVRHLEVYPIIFLRHPIDRAYSAYLFEWKKQKGLREPQGTFSEYVREKFKLPRRNAIEDFQVIHLANRGYSQRNPSANIGDERILENARNLLTEAGYFGVVDRYSDSLKLLAFMLQNYFPDLVFREFHENSLQEKSSTLAVRVKDILAQMEEATRIALVLGNQLDIRLYEYALGAFQQGLIRRCNENGSQYA